MYVFFFINQFPSLACWGLFWELVLVQLRKSPGSPQEASRKPGKEIDSSFLVSNIFLKKHRPTTAWTLDMLKQGPV